MVGLWEMRPGDEGWAPGSQRPPVQATGFCRTRVVWTVALLGRFFAIIITPVRYLQYI